MALTLYVVRHGETLWTRERRYTGWQQIPLSAAGVRQCEAVAQTLSGHEVAQVYASPLERARMSAEVIAAPFGLPVQLEPAFREMGLGRWEGLRHDQVATQTPEAYARWRTAPDRFTPPGGEPLAEVAARVAAGVARLRAMHDGQAVVVVTHAIVIRVMMCAALNVGLDRLWAVDVSPASLTEIEYGSDGAAIRSVEVGEAP